MKISKLSRIDSHEFMSMFKEETGAKLSFFEQHRFECLLDQYRIYDIDKYKKTPVLIRLTLPFYLIFFILVFVGSLFKWILTGTHYYKHEGWVVRLITAWSKKLFHV